MPVIEPVTENGGAIAGDGSRSHPRVLLLQNDTLPNLPLVEAITEAGFILVGPFSTISDAMKYIEKDRPDVVVLDITVSDGISFELADELYSRNIPFLFYTSWRDSDVHAVDLGDVSLAEKPLEFILVVKLLSNMIKNQRSGDAHQERNLTLATE
jgi:DNA-binding NtrC family response regulator